MEQFDKHIKDQLSNFELQPPPGFWHNISDALDQEEAIAHFAPAPKSVFPRILRVAAVFLGLFSLGTLSYVNNKSNVEISKSTFTSDNITSTENQTESDNTVSEIIKPEKTNAVFAQKSLSLSPNNQKVVETKAELVAETQELVAETQDKLTDHATDFNLLETNIPVYSLKLLNKKVPSNDEITVIDATKNQSAPSTSKPKSKKSPLPWRY